MTTPQAPTDRDLIAAALHVYADAIRLFQVPPPNFITTHAAGLPFDQFMRLAGHFDATIRVVEPAEDDTWHPYAVIDLPFGRDLLPSHIHATVKATTGLPDTQRRASFDAHNAALMASDEA